MHLVVDHQAPVLLAEEPEVLERIRARAPPGQHLVRGHSHRADGLLLAGVLADVLGRDPGLVEDRLERKSGATGKSLSVRVLLGGRRLMNTKITTHKQQS